MTLSSRSKPVLLDLYCCQGGAAKGYSDAGFDVIGVDVEPQPRYPFEFRRMDAIRALMYVLDWHHAWRFDAIHASPPCQTYLNLGGVNRSLGRDYSHADLIGDTRELLAQTGLPYVIENVEDAKAELYEPVRLCGSSFGLPLRRHRLFESNVPLVVPPCNHQWQKVKRYWTGWRPKGQTVKSTVVQIYGNAGGRDEWPAAMGVDWMDAHGLCEAVPPAYTEFLGRQLIRFVELQQHEELTNAA